MASTTESVIAGATFFKGLSPSACSRLAEVSRRRPFRKRDTLFMEGTRGEAMYLLLSGSVQLQKGSAGGEITVIKTVRPGEVFAEVILFEQNRYPVSAVAVVGGEALGFPRTDVLRLLDVPAFRDDFIAMVMAKQRYLAERVSFLAAHDVEERLFLFLREQYGEETRIHVAASKKDIAAAIGATPETFSRLIARLTRRRALRWVGRELRLPADHWRRWASPR